MSGELVRLDDGSAVRNAAVALAGERMSLDDVAALRAAARTLERTTLAGRLASLAGKPLEFLSATVPAVVSDAVSRATEAALRTALRIAITSLSRGAVNGRPRFNTLVAATSGAIGGAFGLAMLPIELPLSTTLMLRAIAEIARREGEDLAEPETALACLQVFALGGRRPADEVAGEVAQSGYFAVRGILAKSMGEAARLLAQRGLVDEGAPALVRFAAQIASRFGLVVSQKVAAGSVPVLGAIGGAAVNAAFMGHFQTIASAHFTVRRLERQYGGKLIRDTYEEIRQAGIA